VKAEYTARHKARMCALQALYEKLISNNEINEISATFLNDTHNSKMDKNYFQALLLGVTEHSQQLDGYMLSYLDRPITQITPIELCILRLAIFELTQQPTIPHQVIINEAIELTKDFGATDGFKYINSILDQVAKNVRSEVIKSTLKTKEK
jgi:transcription antitermination protein NusB